MSEHPYAKLVEQSMERKLSLDDEITFACNESGRCCFGTPVLINPHDIWRMVTTPSVGAAMGIWNTTQIFHARPSRPPLVSLYLGEGSRVPVASIYHDEETEACPFLTASIDVDASRLKRSPVVRQTVDGRPRFLCGIHEGRPTICRAFPVGRAKTCSGEGDFVGGETIWIDVRDNCDDCYAGSRGGEAMTVREWLDRTGSAEGHRMTDLWWEVLGRIKACIESEELRFMVGVVAYDFDAAWVRRGLTNDEVAARRPPDYPAHLARVREFVEAVGRRDFAGVIQVLRRYGIREVGEGALASAEEVK